MIVCLVRKLDFWIAAWIEKLVGYWYNGPMKKCGFSYLMLKKARYQIISEQKNITIPAAHREDSDQTGRMPRLIWVFAGRIAILLVLSWGGSILL